MLYESDITGLIDQWKDRAESCSIEQSYKDGINDCIYDLLSLLDKISADESLAQESFDQTLKNDSDILNEYFSNYVNNGPAA